jgi:hypothetical protein
LSNGFFDVRVHILFIGGILWVCLALWDICKCLCDFASALMSNQASPKKGSAVRVASPEIIEELKLLFMLEQQPAANTSTSKKQA